MSDDFMGRVLARARERSGSDSTTAETPTMRERLAQIAAGNHWDRVVAPLSLSHPTRDSFVATQWRWFLDDNDAILREMLEPSEGMLAALCGDAGFGHWCATDAAAWRLMIQYILNEPQD